MGKPVILDSDDVEFLLYAAGAMKHIEMALYAAKTDFQYNLAKPRVAEVVDRANHARLSALRGENEIDQSALYAEDRRLLLEFFSNANAVVTTSQRLENWHGLREIGAVEIGVTMSGFKWADKFDVRPSSDGSYGLRLTVAGKKLYEAITA